MKKISVKMVATQVMVAAMYVVLVYAFAFLSFSAIQFRIAEVLLVLVLFNPKYAFGLLVGTFLANLASPFGIIDSAVGTLASGIAIGLMIAFHKRWFLALGFPALINAIIIPIMIIWVEIEPSMALFEMLTSPLYYTLAGWVFLGEAVVLYGLGIPLYQTIKKNEFILELIND